MAMKNFFADLSQKAAAAADTAMDALSDAGRIAGEKADIAKQTLELSRMKNEQKELFCEIGRAMFAEKMGGGSAARKVEELLAQAGEKEHLINAQSAAIAQASGKVECPGCRKLCKDDAAFCPHCGTALTKAAPAAPVPAEEAPAPAEEATAE